MAKKLKKPINVVRSNAAGRMLAILQTVPVKRFGYELASYFELMGTIGDSDVEAGIALDLLRDLNANVERDLKNANLDEGQQEAVLSGLKSLRRFLYPKGYDFEVRSLSDSEVGMLRLCAASTPSEKEIDEQELEDIERSIDELKAIVREGGLPKELRAFLLEMIRLSEDAINRVYVSGADGLREALKVMLADALEMYSSTPKDKQDELRESTVWKKAMHHMQLFDAVASRVLAYGPLLQSTVTYFLTGPS